MTLSEFLEKAKAVTTKGKDVTQKFNGDYYFKAPYAENLKKSLMEYGWYDAYKTREFVSMRDISPMLITEEEPIKMTSVASSSRLTFLYYLKYRKTFERKGWEVKPEASLPIHFKDGKADAYAHPDMEFHDPDGNALFRECKCQEPYRKKESLVYRYKDLLEEEFSVTDFETEEKHGITFIKLSKKSLGIEDDLLEDDITSYHIDVKQIITHLLGILSVKARTIRYRLTVFVTDIHDDGQQTRIFHEFTSLLKSKAITYYLNKHNNIDIDMEFVSMDSLEDPIFEESYPENTL